MMFPILIERSPAEQPGELDGWKITCDLCGLVWTTSLSLPCADLEARQHLEWHERTKSCKPKS